MDPEPSTEANYSLNPEAIDLVESYAALEAMQQHIFPDEAMQTALDSRSQPESMRQELHFEEIPQNGSSTATAVESVESNGTTPISNADSSERREAGKAAFVDTQKGHTYKLVGMDAEWQPLDSFSPVTLLQISTRSKAFLIDMLWFCRPAPPGWSNSGGKQHLNKPTWKIIWQAL